MINNILLRYRELTIYETYLDDSPLDHKKNIDQVQEKYFLINLSVNRHRKKCYKTYLTGFYLFLLQQLRFQHSKVFNGLDRFNGEEKIEFL